MKALMMVLQNSWGWHIKSKKLKHRAMCSNASCCSDTGPPKMAPLSEVLINKKLLEMQPFQQLRIFEFFFAKNAKKEEEHFEAL